MAIHVNENGTIQELASQSKGDIKLQKVDFLEGPYVVHMNPTSINGSSLKDIATSEGIVLLGDYQTQLRTDYINIFTLEYDFEPKIAIMLPMQYWAYWTYYKNYPSTTPSHYITPLYQYNAVYYVDMMSLSTDIPYTDDSFQGTYSTDFTAGLRIGWPLLWKNKIYIQGYLDTTPSNAVDFNIYPRILILLFA